MLSMSGDKKGEKPEGPVQSHNPDERVWEYDGDGKKIYKLDEGYQKKTPYTESHFWKDRG